MALSPEQYASELRFKLSLQGRVDVEQVASSLGIRVYEDELDGCDGVLLRLDGKALIITSRKCTYSTRKRFTIAHESGHFCIPSHDSCEFRRWPPLKFTLGLDGLIHMSRMDGGPFNTFSISLNGSSSSPANLFPSRSKRLIAR